LPGTGFVIRRSVKMRIYDESFTVEGDFVPAGIYSAEFTSVQINDDPNDENVKKYGPSLLWTFTITEGDYKGKIAKRFSTVTKTPNTIAGKMVGAIRNKKITPGEDITTMVSYFGTKGNIQVEDYKETTRVSGFKFVAAMNKGQVKPSSEDVDIPF
jgi:hypothetical protein